MPKHKRYDDPALVLLERLKGALDDPEAADRILTELGRFYEPLVGGAIVPRADRRAILTLVEAGERDEALQRVEALIARYTRHVEEPIVVSDRGDR